MGHHPTHSLEFLVIPSPPTLPIENSSSGVDRKFTVPVTRLLTVLNY